MKYTKSLAIQQMLSLGLLVNKENEESYLKEVGIERKILGEGITLLCCHRPVVDSEQVDIDLQYDFGSYFDPVGKEGITHLLEHLWFSEEFNVYLNDNQVSKNGWTSTSGLNMNLSGTWNLDFPTYSIPNVLGEVFKTFFTPTNYRALDRLAIEKNVVLREIRESDTDFFRYSLRNLYWPAVLPSHEITTNTLGTENSLLDLSLADLESHVGKFFTGNNSYIKVFTEGGERKNQQIVNSFSKLFENVHSIYGDRAKIPEYDFDPSTFDVGKFELSTGDRFKDKSMVMLSIPLRIPLADKLDLALKQYDHKFSNDLFVAMRKNGLAYSADVWRVRINSEYILFGAYFVSTKEVVRELAPRFVEEFTQIFRRYVEDPSIWEKEIKLEKIKQDAVPILKSNMIDEVFNALMEYDYLYDVYKYREIIQQVTAEDMTQFSRKVVDSNLTVHLIGDL